MKKILTVSLGALLVATAANAETTNTGIASVSYVDGQVSAVQTTANTANTNATTANNAIAAMDLRTVGGTTSVVRSVTQTNGKVTATAETVDTTPTSGSAKLITSGGVYTALSNKQDASTIGTVNATNMGTTATTVVAAIKEVAGEAATAQSTAETASSTAGTAYATARGVSEAIAGMNLAVVGAEGSYINAVKQTNGIVNASMETADTTPTSGSKKMITSGGVYTALSNKQDASTIGTVNATNMGTTATTVVTAIKEVAGEAAAAQTTANTASTNATTANNAIAAMDLATVGGTTSVIRSVAQTNGKVTATAEAVDTAPTGGSAKLITSGGVYLGLEEKVDKKQGTENAGKGLLVDGTNGELVLADIATQEELETVASTAASGQTATQVNTAITNAINNLDVASVGGAGQFVITIKQENGKIDAGVKSFVNTLSDGVLDAPTTDAVYNALQGKLSTTGTAARATADASGNTFTTTYATKTELNGKLGTSLGASAASKAVITNSSGGITSGTIATGMITDGAVTSDKIAGNAVTGAKIANSTITNDDISANAAIAQSKISGLTNSLAGKQDAAPRDESGNSYFVATSDGVWKDMFSAMPRDRACDEDGVKCALTHKSGQYAWEIVRE